MANSHHRARRFFSSDSISGLVDMRLSADAARHAIRVLRLKTGETIRLFDESGLEREATITRIDKQDVCVALGDNINAVVESTLELSLAVAMIRGERMDFIVQKSTELGVSRITPLITQRGLVRPAAEKMKKRLDHWQSVARSACEQCGRRLPPRIEPIIEVGAYLEMPENGRKLLLDPYHGASVDFSKSDNNRPQVLLIGPEGGFSDQEIDQACAIGFKPVSLGPRILRTETAAIAGVTLLQALHGDLLKNTGQLSGQ